MSATAQALTAATNALVATVQQAVTLMATLLADLQAAQANGDTAAEQAQRQPWWTRTHRSRRPLAPTSRRPHRALRPPHDLSGEAHETAHRRVSAHAARGRERCAEPEHGYPVVGAPTLTRGGSRDRNAGFGAAAALAGLHRHLCVRGDVGRCHGDARVSGAGWLDHDYGRHRNDSDAEWCGRVLSAGFQHPSRPFQREFDDRAYLWSGPRPGASTGMRKLLSILAGLALAAPLCADVTGNVTPPGGNAGVSKIVAGSGVSVSPLGGTGAVTVSATGSGGSVTSVGLADGSTAPFYTITNSPVTGAGTLTFTLVTQAANCVLAGPTTGAAAQPTCRSLVAADLPTIPSTQISGLGTFATANAATPPAIGGTTPAAAPSPRSRQLFPAPATAMCTGSAICRSCAAVNNSANTNTVEDSFAVCTVPAGVMGTNGHVVGSWSNGWGPPLRRPRHSTCDLRRPRARLAHMLDRHTHLIDLSNLGRCIRSDA